MALARATIAVAADGGEAPGRHPLLQALREHRHPRDGATHESADTPSPETRCGAPLNVGFRVMTFGGERKMAVWYPVTTAEAEFSYANGVVSAVAVDARPAPCGRVPLVVFSHGYGGCGLQSLFFTEALARRGYVVAAPNHADAHCGIDGPRAGGGFERPEASFRDPEQWNDARYAARGQDMRAALDAIFADPALGAVVDPARIGVAGHSLGGYTAMGLVGGWSSWREPRFRAALLLSPYAAPFIVHERLPDLAVPVMYQGGTRDLGITPGIGKGGGAYERTPAPKYYVEFSGVGHFGWTNFACRGKAVRNCLAANAEAALVDRYAFAFLDRYVKGDGDTAELHQRAAGVADLRFQE